MGNRYEFIAPCHFGLEAVCKREIADLGYEIVRVEDGKVTFAHLSSINCIFSLYVSLYFSLYLSFNFI